MTVGIGGICAPDDIAITHLEEAIVRVSEYQQETIREIECLETRIKVERGRLDDLAARHTALVQAIRKLKS